MGNREDDTNTSTFYRSAYHTNRSKDEAFPLLTVATAWIVGNTEVRSRVARSQLLNWRIARDPGTMRM